MYAVVAKPIVGTKRREPSVLELLTAQRADALVAGRDMSLTDGKAESDEASRSPPGDDRKQAEGLIRTLEVNGMLQMSMVVGSAVRSTPPTRATASPRMGAAQKPQPGRMPSVIAMSSKNISKMAP